MIPHQYQAAGMQTNPHLARNIDETVQNLKNLETCIDALRNDLVQVAQSTGNLQAAHRLQTPASLASASPWAAQSGAAPWAAQGQLGNVNPLAQSWSSTPFGAANPTEAQFNPYQSAGSPYASAFGANPSISSPYAASPFASAVNPWQQAQIEQVRQAELARQQAFNPWAQASPYAQQGQFGVPPTQVSPYAQQSASPLAAQASFAQQPTPFRHSAHEATARQSPTSPFSAATSVGPF